MNLRHTIHHIEKVLSDNSPLILTAVGVTGTVTTAILTGRASYKAAAIIAEEGERRYRETPGTEDVPEITGRDKFEMLYKLYIPAVGVGVGTVSCIILANRIGTRRAAAVATAYAISEKAFVEYKDKVVEKIGENEERKVRDAIAQDRVDRHPDRSFMVVTDGTQVMCHDAYTNQFFHSDMETLRKAMNDINAQIIHTDYATVSDFYHYINSPELEDTSITSEMGWNTNKMLELNFTTVMYKEKVPCISFEFATVPIRDPYRFC